MNELAGGVVERLAGELVTNVVRHAASPFTVIVRYGGHLVRVEVGDGSRALPEARPASLDDESGRGLLLLEALASGWGVTPTLTGKRVWFEVPAT
jgi:anti-sigma regulatory factor (Ser/Thr protein kinase)